MPMKKHIESLLQFDRDHLWHPYTSMTTPLTVYPVRKAEGATLTLENGEELIDGMASWWSAIHGYNVAEINAALNHQLEHFAHVMFGGLTHKPAVELGNRLLKLTPESLQHLFLADSGSIAVEVALKMALQYWIGTGHPEKQQFAVLKGGYHGDTFATMALADPQNGLHTLFGSLLPTHHFIERPAIPFGEEWNPEALIPLQQTLERHHQQLAALILEPVVQGAGGMYFYHPEYLRQARALCDQYRVLLIADEIATGFGRSGRLFACDHAEIHADILCLGKTLTGGTMTLAATLTTSEVAEGISATGPFMHGPTFMANPLACSAAIASIDLLMNSPWQQRVESIATGLHHGLSPCSELHIVEDVRTLGAIGVVELTEAVDMARIQPMFVERGVWLRPFGKLIYLMPPYILSDSELKRLTTAVVDVLHHYAASISSCRRSI